MKVIVTFSGGKDSLAALLWVREHITKNFTTVFCDTGWEHPLTYEYINRIADRLNLDLVTLKSDVVRQVFVAFFHNPKKNYKYIDFNAFLHLPSLSARRCNSAMFCSTYSCTFAGHLPLSYMASRYSAGTFAITSPL